MAIRNLDLLCDLPAERLHVSPRMALLSICDRQLRSKRPTGFGLTYCADLPGNVEHDDVTIQEVAGFLQQAAQESNISMLLVHCEGHQDFAAAVAWFASRAFKAKFVTQRRISHLNRNAVVRLEDVTHIRVGLPTTEFHDTRLSKAASLALA